jgi:alkylation response protein AidB-like acyl-CoA dehydrogenase
VNFELDEDQAMIKALAERFVADHYTAGQGSVDGRGIDTGSVWRALAETGLLGLPFAESDGGNGGGPVEIITVMEVFGRAYAASPFLSDILMGGRLMAAAGTQAQRDRWLSPIIAGERRVALAHAEHGSRYDMTAISTVMTATGLSGGKTFVSANADAYLVTALDGAKIGLFLVEGNAPRLARRDYRLVDGSLASEIIFDGTPGEKMAGGLAELDRVVDGARLGASAEMVGIMETMLASTVDYVRERRQFGVPIGTFQVIQHRLAEQYARLELARSQLYRAALSPQAGRGEAIGAAKAFISRAAIRLGEECIQLHGGMGVSEELTLGNGHKRLMLLSTLLGDATHETRRYNGMLRKRAG